ncbi:hypothetical protein F5984_19840 [Rudanella paleaurantiibacter]|uniref:Uncharacterized protein n=1 Tax=Rudanella paleaurantiibacter TaxID=2614655 RepID=A0A7J5TV38_9BACT|nr:hypothetical protein [Rudanella paleaurantiibacter]KAB7728009.1 hypothetical protein F5984_19840 [Rudanella paleaurantiibacter]
MAADPTEIKGLIDSNLPDNTQRDNKAGVVRTLLKLVVDWVTLAVNTNLGTWFKVGGGVAGANTDAAYRTGTTIFGRATDDGTGAKLQAEGGASIRGALNSWGRTIANTFTPNGNAMSALDPAAYEGLLINGSNGGPTYMAFHRPGQVIQYLGVDTDNKLKFRDYVTTYVGDVHVNGLTAVIRTIGTQAKRKLVFYQAADNDHQFFGIGMISSQMVYQVPTTVDAHVFMCGSSPATSAELMRIVGTGAILMGTSTNNNTDRLQVEGSISQGWRTKAGWPTSAEIGLNKAVIYKDSSSGELRLWANDGGTRKSILLSAT